jgi:hypothetical protein
MTSTLSENAHNYITNLTTIGTLNGNGAPGPKLVPNYVLQFYIDATNKALYVAMGLTAADWKKITP